jgi:hypothetical protein
MEVNMACELADWAALNKNQPMKPSQSHNTQDALEEEQAPSLFSPVAQGSCYRSDSTDDSKEAEQEDQDSQRELRPDQCGDPEQDRGYAAKQEHRTKVTDHLLHVDLLSWCITTENRAFHPIPLG